MMANTGSRLGSGLIVRKGDATPAIPVPAPAQPLPASAASSPASPLPKGTTGTVAVTVRLDDARYDRLKMHGAKTRRTNQQILVAALDAYLADKEHG